MSRKPKMKTLPVSVENKTPHALHFDFVHTGAELHIVVTELAPAPVVSPDGGPK